jgi:tetratricopeptide (TPR) repeat protein
MNCKATAVTRSVAIGFCGLLLAAGASTLWGATPADYEGCVGAQDPNRVIASCTLIIKDEKETKKNIAVAHGKRGDAYSKLGDLGSAFADYNEAVGIDSKSYNGFLTYSSDRGEIITVGRSITRGQGPGAEQQGTSYDEAYDKLGLAYSSKGEFDRAIAVYDKAISVDPGFVQAYSSRSLARLNNGDIDPAIADYSEAIRLAPTGADAWNNRCWARAIVGRQLQLALADCGEALRLRSNNTDALDSRGFVHLKLGQFDDAIADFDAALRLEPKLASSLYGRGIARREKGDRAGSEADIAAAKALQANIAEEFTRYGVK